MADRNYRFFPKGTASCLGIATYTGEGRRGEAGTGYVDELTMD